MKKVINYFPDEKESLIMLNSMIFFFFSSYPAHLWGVMFAILPEFSL